jgi:hypothetical protein
MERNTIPRGGSNSPIMDVFAVEAGGTGNAVEEQLPYARHSSHNAVVLLITHQHR